MLRSRLFKVCFLSFFLLLTPVRVFADDLANQGGTSAAFAEAKLKFDTFQFLDAANDFKAIANDDSSPDRAQAAVFMLRGYRRAQKHALVMQNFSAAAAAAASTPYAVECTYEQALSLYKNAHKVTDAYIMFGTIADSHPESIWAGSGSIFQRGTIQLEKYHSLSQAAATMHSMLETYPTSPFAAKAYFILLRCAILSNDPTAVDAAHQQFVAACPISEYLPDAELRHGDFEMRVRGSTGNALQRYRNVVSQWPNTDFARSARLRINEIAPDGFEAAIADCTALLGEIRDHPKFKFQKNLCRLLLGQYYYQLGLDDNATSAFQSVLAQNPGPQPAVTARTYLDAIADPPSTSGLYCLYERAMRWRDRHGYMDKCWDDLAQMRAFAEMEPFNNYISDESVSSEDRSSALYRLALGNFDLGDHDVAAEIAQRVLDELHPTRVARYECLYLIAYHHAHCGHFDHAISLYRSLIDENSGYAAIVPPAYFEMAKKQQLNGQHLAAMLTLEEFRTLYPYRAEVQRAIGEENRISAEGPDLQIAFAQAKSALLAQIGKHARPVLLAESPPIQATAIQPATIQETGTGEDE